MARKNLLKNLIPTEEHEAPETSGTGHDADAAALPARSRPVKGAIGAVSRSIADLKARAVVELDPFAIEAGGMKDRLEHDEAEEARLRESLLTHGQQVPVLVRPHPETEGRYQIVYGRRRVLALRDLGQPVKALVRDLDDRELVVAQGQENTARRNLSFIEKANFARQMVEAGYDRKIICDALSVDKTVLSRMLAVADRVPVALIEAVGSAPNIGRDRWLALAEAWESAGVDAEAAASVLDVSAGQGSNVRFEALLRWLSGRRSRPTAAKTPPTETLHTDDGRPLAQLTRTRGGRRLTFTSKDLGGFDEWLVQNLSNLHRDWIRRQT